MMKLNSIYNYLLLACIIGISGAGCRKIDKFTKFKISYEESVTVPSSLGINLPFKMATPDIPSNTEAVFSINDTRKDLIEKIQLSTLKIKVKNPVNGDFSFLKSVEILISANGLSDTKIAWKDPVADDAGNEIWMDVSGADLKDYINKDSFSLKINIVTDEIISTDHEIGVFAEFNVDAKILGQ